MVWVGILAGLLLLAGGGLALRSEGSPRARAGLLLASCVPLLLWLALQGVTAPEAPPVEEPVARPVPEELPPLEPWPEEVEAPEPAPKRKAAPLVTRKPYTPEEVAKLRERTSLMGTANVIRHYEGERQDYHMVGLKVSNVKPRSFWALAGVRSGDLIVEWEGEPVTGAEISIRVIQEMGAKDELDFVVEGEDGERRVIRYTLPEALRAAR